VHHNNKIGLHGCWFVTECFKNIRKESTIAATFGHPTAKEISASGGFTPLPLIRSSAPAHRWALRPHTHVIGLRSALAMWLTQLVNTVHAPARIHEPVNGHGTQCVRHPDIDIEGLPVQKLPTTAATRFQPCSSHPH